MNTILMKMQQELSDLEWRIDISKADNDALCLQSCVQELKFQLSMLQNELSK